VVIFEMLPLIVPFCVPPSALLRPVLTAKSPSYTQLLSDQGQEKNSMFNYLN